MSLLSHHGGHSPHFGSIHSSVDDLPLFGREGEAIEGELLSQLLRRQVHPGGSHRKRLARVAYDVYRTCFEGHILDGIRLQQNSVTIRNDMARFLTKARNDARDVTEQVAVVWQNGAERHLVDEDGTEDEEGTAAIRGLAQESRFNVIAQMINHLAWLQGPQFAVPIVRGAGARRRLCADVVSPHVYDIVQDELDPLGFPVGLAWHIHHRQVSQNIHEDNVWVLDGVSLRQFRVRTSSVGDLGTQVPLELASEPIEHGYGRLPAALLRFTEPIAGDDWFLCESNSRLVSGTIEIGVKMARLGLTRRAQNHKLLTMIGRVDAVAKGQEPADPEAGIVASTLSGTGAVSIDVLDYDTDPDNFIKEILFHVQCLIEPLGGRIRVDSGAPEIFGTIEIPHEVQVEHRDTQKEPSEGFETVFWSATTAMLRVDRHPLALDLPAPDDVLDRYRVTFGPLTRALKDPEKENANNDWRLSKGHTSEVELKRAELGGGATDDEAWKVVEQNMNNRGRFNEMATRAFLTTDDGDVQTTAEALGAMGTTQREANRADEAQGEGDEGAGGSVVSEPT